MSKRPPKWDPLMDAVKIGARVRKLRSEMGLNTVTLAKKMRLSQAQVSRLENGLQAFRSATLSRFARVLGVSPAYLMVGPDAKGKAAVTPALEKAGLTPSAALRKALRDPAFLRFAEFCARAMKQHKKNLVRMEKAIRSGR